MRVTAGIAKGHKLTAPLGLKTRPTADKIKQSVFNMINSDLEGAAFLDLFAGSGQIGIEALSRGASSCTFVDTSRKALYAIAGNLAHTKLSDKASTYLSDAACVLDILSGLGHTYNIVFMDPPYNMSEQIAGLSVKIGELKLLKPGGYIIGEHSADFDILKYGSFNLLKKKIYGKTTVISLFTPA